MINQTTLFICGPTASGKSALAMRLAEELGGEIICADSQTIRRGMDIGTAKPSQQDQKRVPHHLLDIIGPFEDYNLSRFLIDARRALEDIHKKGRKAIIVGGTGLYIDALYFQFELPVLPTDTIHADLESKSINELQDIIAYSGYIMPKNVNNPRHLVNVIKRGGEIGRQNQSLEDSVIIGISPDLEILKDRIDTRVEAMFEAGFIEEVRTILEMYGEPMREFDAIGYKLAHRVIRGELSVVDAKELFKTRDRQYAKRQLSWLRRNKDILWYESAETAYEGIMEL